MVEKSKASSSAVQANEGNRLCCASYGSAKACNDHLSWSSEQARKFSLFGIEAATQLACLEVGEKCPRDAKIWRIESLGEPGQRAG
jgi:hypothetical protein